MAPTPPPWYINGEEPPIAGAVCEGLILLQFQEGTQITDPVNVAYFQFLGRWFCLYFDCKTVFWHEAGPPELPVNSTLDHGLALMNLDDMKGVVGARLDSVAYAGDEDMVAVTMAFAGGRTLTFRHGNLRDRTVLEA
jgi:hypothetical protein